MLVFGLLRQIYDGYNYIVPEYLIGEFDVLVSSIETAKNCAVECRHRCNYCKRCSVEQDAYIERFERIFSKYRVSNIYDSKILMEDDINTKNMLKDM